VASPNPLRPEHFQREDESDDARFYAEPRLVTHIDDRAIAALRDFYRRVLPAGGDILDLMSSCVSHLPDDLDFRSVTGLGMNMVELEANPQLTARATHDLNRDPTLPFPDASFDAAVISVSVQYLTKPVEVFTDLGRVLRPGSPVAIAYSNRCFPTKAVAIWRMTGDREHADVVGLYLRLAAAYTRPQAFDLTPPAEAYTDPLYAVLAYTQAPEDSK
jgi:SAM-dependent methyltransferase